MLVPLTDEVPPRTCVELRVAEVNAVDVILCDFILDMIYLHDCFPLLYVFSVCCTCGSFWSIVVLLAFYNNSGILAVVRYFLLTIKLGYRYPALAQWP